MKTYTINNKKYYLWTDLQRAYPKLFVGCKNGRVFITKKKVNNKNYVIAKLDGKKWVSSDGSSKKFDKIFILESWFNKTYHDDSDDSDDSAEEAVEEETSSESDESNESDESEETTDKAIPKIIELKNNEKFVDNDDNIIEIEVRGERKHDKCYFSVKDIEKGFKINRLRSVITFKKSGYKLGIHYTYFNCSGSINYVNGSTKKLFVTYTGLLRILFASHKNTADKFVNWASKTLFTAQMGTNTQRQELAGNLLGVSIQAVKEVFNKTSNTISCIYLLSLGLVKNLRKVFKVDDKYKDTDYVYKWGMTDSLARRIEEHRRTFSKISNTDLKLVTFGLIDPTYVSKAETKIKNMFESMDLILTHDTFEELAVIPSNKTKYVKDQYSLISNTYVGQIKDLVSQVTLLTETHAKEMAIKETEVVMAKKDIEVISLKKDNELLKKDLEIANLKLAMKQK